MQREEVQPLVTSLPLENIANIGSRSDDGYDFPITSSACSSTSGRPSPRNVWDDYQRLLIVVLRRFYDINWNDICRIFNHCFRDRLRLCGFVRGIPKNRILSQYMDWSSHKVRKAVFETPFHNVWRGVDDHIQKAARKLHINLPLRAVDSARGDFNNKLCGGSGSRKLSASQRKTLKARPLLGPGTTWPEIEAFHENHIQPLNLSYKPLDNSAAAFARSGTTLPDPAASPIGMNAAEPLTGPRCPFDPPTAPESHRSSIPSLLYRTYTSKNAGINLPAVFIAGQFAQLSGETPPPISSDHPLFQTMLENHINKREVLGPFISLTDSLLWAIFIASRSPEDAHVSVIETKHLDNIYPILDYMQDIPLESRHKRYKGTCEYLVWAKVPGSAIRGDFCFSSLKKIAGKSLNLSSISSGRSVVRISSLLASKEIPLTEKIGAKIGCLVRLMGFSMYSESALLSRAVETLIQGWSFKGPLRREVIEAFVQHVAAGDEAQDSIASSFGRKNCSRSFQEGVDRGLSDLDGKKARNRRISQQNIRKAGGLQRTHHA